MDNLFDLILFNILPEKTIINVMNMLNKMINNFFLVNSLKARIIKQTKSKDRTVALDSVKRIINSNAKAKVIFMSVLFLMQATVKNSKRRQLP